MILRQPKVLLMLEKQKKNTQRNALLKSSFETPPISGRPLKLLNINSDALSPQLLHSG